MDYLIIGIDGVNPNENRNKRHQTIELIAVYCFQKIGSQTRFSKPNSPSQTIGNPIRRKSKQFKPEIVLHLPHTVDTSKTWRNQWGELLKELESVKHYVSSIYYSRGSEPQREQPWDAVLQNARGGDVVDLIYTGK